MVIGCDSAPGYIAYAQGHLVEPRASLVIADAVRPPPLPGGYDAVVAGLVLNFLPNALEAVAAMVSAARPGGIVAAYVWDYAGRMQMMRYFWDAAVVLNPNAAPLDEGRRFSLCSPAALSALFHEGGLQNIEPRTIEVITAFRNFDDYWNPFLGQQGPAPGYVASLGEEERAALREQLRQTLPIKPDGRIDLAARAWAIRGRRP
jgi:SAM-dependent methyltransferase